MTTSTSLKEVTRQFLERIVAGDIRPAFDGFTAPTFRHHNSSAKSDRQSLIESMQANHVQFPDKQYTILHLLQDGDMVAAHGRIQLANPGPELAVVHLLRFENDLITEMWDVGQAVPDPTINERGMF